MPGDQGRRLVRHHNVVRAVSRIAGGIESHQHHFVGAQAQHGVGRHALRHGYGTAVVLRENVIRARKIRHERLAIRVCRQHPVGEAPGDHRRLAVQNDHPLLAAIAVPAAVGYRPRHQVGSNRVARGPVVGHRGHSDIVACHRGAQSHIGGTATGISRDGDIRRAGNGRRRHVTDCKRRRAGKRGAHRIADEQRVSAGIGALDTGQRQRSGGRTRQICPVVLPLPAQRLESGGHRLQTNGGAPTHVLTKGLDCNSWVPVALQRHQVEPAAGHPHHVCQSHRNIGLAVGVVAPGDHGPVSLQGQGVIAASSHSHHVAQSGRRIGLPVGVVAPCHDRSVRLKGDAVIASSSD